MKTGLHHLGPFTSSNYCIECITGLNDDTLLTKKNDSGAIHGLGFHNPYDTTR